MNLEYIWPSFLGYPSVQERKLSKVQVNFSSHWKNEQNYLKTKKTTETRLEKNDGLNCIFCCNRCKQFL